MNGFWGDFNSICVIWPVSRVFAIRSCSAPLYTASGTFWHQTFSYLKLNGLTQVLQKKNKKTSTEKACSVQKLYYFKKLASDNHPSRQIYVQSYNRKNYINLLNTALNSFHPSVAFHIETNHLIWTENL